MADETGTGTSTGTGTDTGNANGSSENGDSKTAVVASKWTFASVTVALLALIGLVVYAGENYTSVQDTTTLLGVVLPAVVSIGAAAFGIRIAYDKGENTGAKQKESELKAKLKPLTDQAQTTADQALEPVMLAFDSPPGTEDLVLQAGASLPGGELRIPGASVNDAREALAELRGAVEALD